MVRAVTPDGRRQRRREQTVVEILAAAVEAMAADGVAGMSLSDVARRVGMQPPSLYEYFPSKLALYDAVFKAGYEELNTAVFAVADDIRSDPLGTLFAGYPVFVRWCIEHPVQAQLMFWRPVPKFEPSAEAFAPSVEQMLVVKELITLAAAKGQLSPAAASEEAVRLYAVIGSGLITQQLANDPDGQYPDGYWNDLAAAGIHMWFNRYAPEPTTGSAES
jgi:AcrR family transcriptional regulator